MIFDLHSHTTLSDGVLASRELVLRAIETCPPHEIQIDQNTIEKTVRQLHTSRWAGHGGGFGSATATSNTGHGAVMSKQKFIGFLRFRFPYAGQSLGRTRWLRSVSRLCHTGVGAVLKNFQDSSAFTSDRIIML